MKYENWEILDLAEHDFEEMKWADKDSYIRQWLISTRDKQLEKGILRKDDKYFM